MKCQGISPPALCGHAACVVDNRMYLHGGFADQVSILVYTVLVLVKLCVICKPEVNACVSE